jgi:hypothetical protein
MATAERYALAQQAGYTGADSLGGLAQWMGKVKDPGRQLDSIMTAMTVHAGSLAADVENLATAMNPLLSSAMDQAIVQASGGTKVLEGWAQSVLNGNNNARQFNAQAWDMARMVLKVYGNVGLAHREFDAFNAQMGISKGVSDTLWADMITKSGAMKSQVQANLAAVQQAISNLHGKTVTVNVETIQSMITVPGSGGGWHPPMARGYASGTSGAASGWAWVGEAGPELVRFRGGETVIPNSVARGYAGGTDDSSVHEIHVYIDGKKMYRGIKTEAVNTQRRTGSNGLSKRTR